MGSLTVVGTGIQPPVHMTAGARESIERADEVLYLAEPAAGSWIEELNPRSRSLGAHYRRRAPRRTIYEAIAAEVVERARAGGTVCLACPGHPGLFADATHAAIQLLRSEGVEVGLLPGISAEDCLFADLGVDPGRTGWQSHEATSFLVYKHPVDPSAALVLWQVGIVGNVLYVPEGDQSRLPILVERLERDYPSDHEVVLYESSPYPIFDPTIVRLPLADLARATVPPMATMYVPPSRVGERDEEMVERLRLGQAENTPEPAP